MTRIVNCANCGKAYGYVNAPVDHTYMRRRVFVVVRGAVRLIHEWFIDTNVTPFASDGCYDCHCGMDWNGEASVDAGVVAVLEEHDASSVL